MGEPIEDIETFRMADLMMQVFRSAVRKAQEESRRLGVPNVYWINGKRYFEQPDGSLLYSPIEEPRRDVGGPDAPQR